MTKNKSSQKRKTQNYYDRNAQSKIWFLIVCEGEKTEPNYFRNFPVDKKVIQLDIKGEGYNTKSLVEKVIELKEETENYNPDQDQIWCVFDRDKNPKNNDSQNFNDALKLAEKHELKVAYSNDAFELWYLLHFHYYDTAISRKEYQKMLTKNLGYKYKKNSQIMYEKLKDQQEDAIRNAKRLLSQCNPLTPEKNNPSTTVHLLVEALNYFIP